MSDKPTERGDDEEIQMKAPYTKTKMGNLRLTLTNDFHGTETTVIAKPSGAGPRQYTISRKQAMRAAKALCGIPTCLCANGPAGTRNQRFVEMTPCEDGGVAIYVTPIG